MRTNGLPARPIRFASAPSADDGASAHDSQIIELHDWNPSATASARLQAVEPVPADAPDDLVYEIDAEGRLVAVSDQWDAFALANGAPELRANRVIGRPFWSFFDDADGLVDEHRQMLDRCRARDQRGTFLLRCDAPNERRMLRMWIEPIGEGRFRFTSRTLALESLDPDLYDRLLRVAPSPTVARCSHCNRFRYRDDWFEPELALRREYQRPSRGAPTGKMVHTLCPSCRQSLRAVPRLVRKN